jgi:hypothetical protein
MIELEHEMTYATTWLRKACSSVAAGSRIPGAISDDIYGVL